MSLVVRDYPQYLNAAAFDADATYSWIGFESVNQGSFSISWTGTWTGTIFVEGGNGGHYMTPLSNFNTDITHTLLQLTVTAGVQPDPASTTKWLAEILPSAVKGVRIRLAVSSGSGTITAHYFGKSTG